MEADRMIVAIFMILIILTLLATAPWLIIATPIAYLVICAVNDARNKTELENGNEITESEPVEEPQRPIQYKKWKGKEVPAHITNETLKDLDNEREKIWGKK